jgi:6,7-dimethyl-8-ribityllumazine synthase
MLKTKMKKILTFQRVIAIAALSLLCVISTRYPLFAQAVTQGYGADQIMQRGMLVQLKKGDTTKVEVVKQETADQMYGVVVNANDAPVTLSSDGKKVFVATAGHYDVLVNTQNGEIKAGDYVTVSAIDGIGMKASDKEPVVVGRALSGFDGKSNVISTPQVKDSNGGSKTVSIGRVQADILVAKNPLLKAEEPNLPSALKKVSESIAGKPVNPARVYISMFVFLLSTIVATTLMYGGVRSAIISIGRNPLSKKSIIKGMFQIIITGLTVFISGIFGVYLLLKL